MKKEQNFVTSLHLSTKRNYLQRMINDKVKCIEVAKKYGKDYWDGKRSFGYGGYKYIPGRWKPVAEKLIETYNLSSFSKILDVGCGKGFLLYEIQKLLPEIELFGFDISYYGIQHAKDEIKKNLSLHKAQEKFKYQDQEFDLVISLGTLHNLKLSELSLALSEISRVGKKQYVMVESYRNSQELFNLQCWALTAEMFLDNKEWIWLFNHFKYKGDYEFIYFE